MAETKKILMKMALVDESSYGVYVAPTYLIPFMGAMPKQSFAMIEDDANVGTAFKNLPLQGVRSLGGSGIEVNAEVNTLPLFLRQICGQAAAGNVYTPIMTSNPKSMSSCVLDAIKTNKHAGIVMNNFKLSSQSDGKLKLSFDPISCIAEVRDDTAFPTITTSPGTELLHQHAGGTNGYFRVGDQADALAAGDNLSIKSCEFSINWNFAMDSVNSQTQLQPKSAMAEVSLAFQIAEHTTDAFKAFADARTPLQLEAKFYAGAAAYLIVRIPNFIMSEAPVSSDDKGRIDPACIVGRNGVSSAAYDNGNMTFNAPIQFECVNS